MKTDSRVQEDVMDELKWDASLTHEAIGVAVEKGIVTLTGSVPSFAEKEQAEKATFRVAGVQSVVDHLQVKALPSYERSDTDIAWAATNALDWDALVPEGVKVVVENGVVTLEGQVSWKFQKDAAFDAVKSLMGVKHVSNRVQLASMRPNQGLKAKIQKAIQRSRLLPSEIKVEVAGGVVTLDGKVNTYGERDAVEAAAWSAPGVSEVKDHIQVALSYDNASIYGEL